MWSTLFTGRSTLLAIVTIAFAVTLSVDAYAQQTALEVVSSFDNPTQNGSTPAAMLVQASDGSFYGTTSAGGRFGRGTIFRITPAGEFSSLHDFSGDDGATPVAPVFQGSDGNVYGTTLRGGASNLGTVFRLDPSGTLTTLRGFDGTDGQYPQAGLIQATDGRFYGTTAGIAEPQGSGPGGTLFRIDASGTFETLFRFPAGIHPHIELFQWSDGNLYGGTFGPGFGSAATIFRSGLSGAVTTLRTFAGGQSLSGPLREAREGYLYGVTSANQPNVSQVFFKLNTAGTFSDIPFPSNSAPPDSVVQARDGNFYGVMGGRVFRMDASGNRTTLTLVDVGEQSLPTGLLIATDGNFYGTTAPVGLLGIAKGTVFKWDFASQATTTLFVFGRDGAGANPETGVVQGPDGRLYGTALNGGALARGSVYVADGSGALQALHSFTVEEGRPHAGLLLASDGNFYGSATPETDPGQPHGHSTLFRIDSGGSFALVPRPFTLTTTAWEITRGTLLLANDGNFYGTNSSPSEAFVNGPQGSGGRFFSFGGATGFAPFAGLIQVANGDFYGTTSAQGPGQQGTVFKLSPDAQLTVVRGFSGLDGAKPLTPVRLGSDGRLYGTTSEGGAVGAGTAFAVDISGDLTTLHDFNGFDGLQPLAGLLLASDGNYYGTTCKGGSSYQPNVSNAFGTVFKVTASGEFTTLHSFSGTNGSCPSGELIQAGDGHLYGTTQTGGQNGVGVLFRVRLGTTAPPPSGYFEIVSRNSGKCLDVYGASTEAVAQIIQWTCHGGANQQWRLEPAGGGAFRIIARHSGQALDVFGALVDDATPIIQYPVTGGDNQAWTLEPASDGYVRIVARHSGQAMDVEFASTDDGARVIQYTPHGNANQQWILRPVN